MPSLGWTIAAISGCLIFLLIDARALLNRNFVNRKFAEFLCTSAKLISVPSIVGFQKASGSLRRSRDVGIELYWASQLKALDEGTPHYDPIAGGGAGLIFCGLLVLSLRPGVAAFATLLLVAGVISLSKLKFKYVRINLHAYDFVHFSKSSNIAFFWKTYRAMSIKILATITFGIILLSTLAAFEPAEVGVYDACVALLIALLLFSVVVLFLRPPPKLMGHLESFDRPVNLSKFTESVFETMRVWRRGGLLAAVPANSGIPRASVFGSEAQPARP